MMFDSVERLCRNLSNVAKIITWHTVAVSTFKKDRKTTDELELNDEIYLAIQELKKQLLAKDISKIELTHAIVVNYSPISVAKDIAILEMGHVQLINYLNQGLDKYIAEVSL